MYFHTMHVICPSVNIFEQFCKYMYIPLILTYYLLVLITEQAFPVKQSIIADRGYHFIS
jgi:hypothetical protein